MKRSSFITWDQLKVGVLIIVALLILAIAMIRVGKAGNLFGKRFQLVSFIHSAAGLRIGGPVTVAGQLAGSIKDIKFLPPDVDTMRNLKVLLEVNTTVRDQGRQDSRAKIQTMGLLGDKVFDISVGTPRYRPLHEGDTLVVLPSMDYEGVVRQASAAISEVVTLTRDLKRVTSGITRGEGTLGQLVTNRELYDQLNATLSRTSALMARLENPRGTIGRLLDRRIQSSHRSTREGARWVSFCVTTRSTSTWCASSRERTRWWARCRRGTEQCRNCSTTSSSMTSL